MYKEPNSNMTVGRIAFLTRDDISVSTAELGDSNAKGSFISNPNDWPYNKGTVQKKRKQEQSFHICSKPELNIWSPTQANFKHPGRNTRTRQVRKTIPAVSALVYHCNFD